MSDSSNARLPPSDHHLPEAAKRRHPARRGELLQREAGKPADGGGGFGAAHAAALPWLGRECR